MDSGMETAFSTTAAKGRISISRCSILPVLGDSVIPVTREVPPTPRSTIKKTKNILPFSTPNRNIGGKVSAIISKPMHSPSSMGCGIQRGTTERYRGVPVDSTLLPKVKVDVVVSSIPVDQVIDTAKSALYTGHIGDGKIFVSSVDRVVKVRTGEEDFAALQDVE